MSSPSLRLCLIAALIAFASALSLASSVQAAQPSSSDAEFDRMLERYAPMFTQLGFTPQEAKKFLDLKQEQFGVNRQVQDAARQNNWAGNSPEVDQLRRSLSAPIAQQLNALLGPDGQRLYHRFEVTSFYRVAYVKPVALLCQQASVPLSPAQVEQLVDIVQRNDHQVRRNPTDISTQSVMDWPQVLVETKDVLTPEQRQLLMNYIEKTGRR